MIDINTEQKKFYALLDQKLRIYVKKNLKESLNSIGFSNSFVSYIIANLGKINFREFYKLYDDELQRVYSVGFFQKIVPEYFDNNVVLHVPPSRYLVDIGCGTGILAHRLSKRSEIKKIEGIDIAKYPEWAKFTSKKVHFKIISQKKFNEYDSFM